MDCRRLPVCLAVTWLATAAWRRLAFLQKLILFQLLLQATAVFFQYPLQPCFCSLNALPTFHHNAWFGVNATCNKHCPTLLLNAAHGWNLLPFVYPLMLVDWYKIWRIGEKHDRIMSTLTWMVFALTCVQSSCQGRFSCFSFQPNTTWSLITQPSSKELS